MIDVSAPNVSVPEVPMPDIQRGVEHLLCSSYVESLSTP
jgi:hypothetical protein